MPSLVIEQSNINRSISPVKYFHKFIKPYNRKNIVIVIEIPLFIMLEIEWIDRSKDRSRFSY